MESFCGPENEGAIFFIVFSFIFILFNFFGLSSIILIMDALYYFGKCVDILQKFLFSFNS